MRPDFIVGQKEVFSVVVTEQSVKSFAELTGDLNPLHLDPEYAKGTVFGKCISHGMLVASYISNVIANKLPGPGAIYLSQDLKFLAPVFWGDEIEVLVEIESIREDKPIIKLKTECTKKDGTIVIKGVAHVKI